MKVKTRKPLLIAFLYGCIIAVFFLPIVRGSSGPEVTKKQPYQPMIIISGQLSFALSGVPGEYRETKPVIIKVHRSVRCIHISASPFCYSGTLTKGKQILKATYWIDNTRQCFDSRMPLILYTGALKKWEKPGYIELRLYGKVTIDRISAQPAGEYGGNIMVTVTERL